MEKDDFKNQLMNNEGVCKTAPAAPGLLNIGDDRTKGHNNLLISEYMRGSLESPRKIC